MKSTLPPDLEKTVIVEKEPSVGHPNRRTKDNSHRFDDEDDYQTNVISQNLWAELDVSTKIHKGLTNKIDRENYENFVYGLLYHHDMVDRKGKELHKLYFKWDKPGFKTVQIYISPAPTRTAIDPERPPIPPPPEENS